MNEDEHSGLERITNALRPDVSNVLLGAAGAGLALAATIGSIYKPD